MVYSVLRSSWKVLLAGLAYFVFGHFVHKYQLLYAMDHRQHSTGRGWLMICDRVIVGTVFFQLTMAGQLALNQAFIRSTLIFPLILLTLWFAYVYTRTYRPLMKFIALRSIRRAERSDLDPGDQEENPWVDRDTEEEQSEVQYDGPVEPDENDLRFVNPSLIIP